MKILKILGLIIYLIIFVAIIGKLFFEKEFNEMLYRTRSLLMKSLPEDTLVIGYSEPALTLDPLLSNDVGSRARLAHFYEGLVRTTADLKIEPGLAISYGAADNLTWEFRLRPDVMFHDGERLTVEDVIFSLMEAKNDSDSKIKDLVESISSVEKINDEIFRIKTTLPDPLLLSKLSLVFIWKKDSEKASINGTGPYVLESRDNGSLFLRGFDRYWGAQPYFKKVVLKTYESKEEKINALNSASVDLLANLPTDIGNDFTYANFKLAQMPSVEVNFLMFNFIGPMADKVLREAIVLSIDRAELSKMAKGYAVPAYQFAANGIFGFNPDIEERQINKPGALAILAEKYPGAGPGSPINIKLDFPQGLEALGGKIRDQLRKINVNTELSFLPPGALGQKILSGGSEFFFFGWRSELGDTADFLSAVIHTKEDDFGQFNGSGYSNKTVDKLIEDSRATLNESERLTKLREAMKIIVEKDIVGVPLFVPETLYAVSKNVTWVPRVDGYVLAQDAKK